MKVGLIGLGAMSTGMALNLRKAGYDLVVHDLRGRPAAGEAFRIAEEVLRTRGLLD
ncbi:NAD(P)-binding domain-containing protein [Streptomyces sp. NPDC002577]